MSHLLLYRHALESIFTHLNLQELARVSMVHTDWKIAVSTMKPINVVMEIKNTIPSVNLLLLLRHVSSLTFIDLKSDQIRASVDFMSHDKLLRSMSYSDCDLSDNSHINLIAKFIENHKSITCVDLSSNKIKDVTELATAIQQNHSLMKLNLNSNSIQDAEAVQIATAIKDHPTLTDLDMSYCYIEKNGSNALADAIQKNHLLTRIDLGNCWFGFEGTVLLAGAIKK